jgi:hypothetical protein
VTVIVTATIQVVYVYSDLNKSMFRNMQFKVQGDLIMSNIFKKHIIESLKLK